MSSHVVVIDKTARRYTFNVAPETVLNEVFQQACKKAGLDSSVYGLKHGNKVLDLSLPFRFTKLSSGAKLELVQLPKSRSAISASITVALQMMDFNNARLTEKFPCTTSIWSILRSFEQKSVSLGVSGVNITELAVEKGTGRLYYAMPVVQVFNRELATFQDLQKTLQELGLSAGTALLRLKMKPTDIPLEEALEKISEFAPAGPLPATPPVVGETASGASPPPPPHSTPTGNMGPSRSTEPVEDGDSPKEPPQPSETPTSAVSTTTIEPPQSAASATAEPSPNMAQFRPVTVLAPAQGPVPAAAKVQFHESDYDLTVAQARQIQANLVASGRPQRLLSDAEKAEREREIIAKREKVQEVEVRVRFPDHMIIQTTFKGTDRAEDLYSFVRSALRYPDKPFYLYISPPVRKVSPNAGRLVHDLQFTHRTLVNFSWEGTVSIKEPALNDMYLAQAKAIQVERSQLEIEGAVDEEQEGKGGKKWGKSGDWGVGGMAGKLPKWLKLGGKK